MHDEFELTAQHIALLRNGNVYRYPGLDHKRPFGSGDVYDDMARILEVAPVETDDEEVHWPPGTSSRMGALFGELAVALQIVLFTGSFEPGLYSTPKYESKRTKAQAPDDDEALLLRQIETQEPKP